MDRPTPLTLTQCAIDILVMVYCYGGCTVDHIRRRFFPTKGSRSPCYDWISRLVKAGYLESIRLPSLNGIGSGKAFLTIGPKGRSLVAKALGIPQSELASSRMSSPLFVSHFLSCLDFRLSLEIGAERSSVFTLQEFTTDSELQRSPMRVKDPKTHKDVSLVPDATFTLALQDGSEQAFLLEMDMGTMAPKRLKAKLR